MMIISVRILTLRIIQVDTLIKYLVDSLQSYESGHGDALHPIPLDPEKIFMGDHLALKPVTNEEFFWLKHSIGIGHIDEKLDAVMSTVASAMAPSSDLVSCAVPERSHMLCIHQSPSTRISYHHSDCVQVPSLPTLIPSSVDLLHHVRSGSGSVIIADQSEAGTVSTLPISGVSIPDLGHGPGAWRKAIKQWQEVDPVTNLCVLKDWPKNWYTGVMRTVTGSKRSQRQIVFEEYERYEILTI